MNLNAAINVIGELQRIGWDFEFAGEDELRCRCPFHEDQNPSCMISVDKRLFKCHTAGCDTTGDFITLMAAILKTTRVVIIRDLETRYGIDADQRLLDLKIVERYHTAIWAAEPMVKKLRERGVTSELISKHRLGYYKGRITIPIFNDTGGCVNLRRYLPGAPASEKMRNTRGHGKPLRLYPIDQLEYDNVVICGGEMKAIVAAHLLNPRNIGAVTTTGGEGSWNNELTEKFEGKAVHVCFDIDQAGKDAAQKICAQVRRTSRWVSCLSLPLNIDTYPHGDINDWVGLEGANSKQFIALIEAADEWIPRRGKALLDDNDPIDVSLNEAFDAERTKLRVKVRAVISAVDSTTYLIPRGIIIRCKQDQTFCGDCLAYLLKRDKEGCSLEDIPPESSAVLEMIATNKTALREAMMNGLGIPIMCKSVSLEPKTFRNVEDVRLSPQLNITNNTVERNMQPALLIGKSLELNESYDITGRTYPHPKTQQGVLLASKRVAVLDQLSSYSPSEQDISNLELFRPKTLTLEGIQEKLNEIYDDLVNNVTRIFCRNDMHLIADLTYHSVMLIHLDGKVIKGWVESLILGDSSQGKSEMATCLMNHYNLGVKMDCKNATVAGVLGGLQQLGTRWFVTWGVIPTHDRRLVILDELKGMPIEIVAKLTDMRSSGIAEIPKIEKRRTHARTRLLVLSNPRSNHSLATYNFGVEAVTELIGGLEDVRRFDVIMAAASDDTKQSSIAKLQAEESKIPHVFTSDVCRSAVLWAWTRDKTHFTAEATQELITGSAELCSTYNDAIPIVDHGSMRYKLARLATALACRTYSTDEDAVKICGVHVKFIVSLLHRLYSSPSFGYDDYSKAITEMSTMLDEKGIEMRVLSTPYPIDFQRQMLHTNDIELRDICDWCGWDKQTAIDLLSFLVRKHALKRSTRAYRKTPGFITLLKRIKPVARPKHIGDGNEF